MAERPRPSREQFDAWHREHPDATDRDAREAFPELKPTTRRRWLTEPSAGEPYQHPKLSPKAAAVTPAAKLDPDDRARVIRTVRSILRALEVYAKKVEEAAESGDVFFDPKAAQAAMHMQRTAAGLLEQHPGLLELVKAGEGETADDDDLEDIIRALRGPPARGADG